MLQLHKLGILVLEILFYLLENAPLLLDLEVELVLLFLVHYLTLLQVLVGLPPLGHQVLVLNFHFAHELLCGFF